MVGAATDPNSEGHPDFHVNLPAVDALVDALLDEPEVQLIFMPLLEAEVYRYVLRRMICIAHFTLSQLRISLFGIEVRMSLLPDEVDDDVETAQVDDFAEVVVPAKELRRLLQRVEHERKRVERELQARRGESQQAQSSADGGSCDVSEEVSDFARLASQDRLARSLSVQRAVNVPIDVAFSMVSDFGSYTKWMPFCTSASVLSEEGPRVIICEVGFGLDTAIGNVGDTVKYRVTTSPPGEAPPPKAHRRLPEAGPGCPIRAALEGFPGAGGAAGGAAAAAGAAGLGAPLRAARVVADTPEGFAYGKRLVYDWRFVEVAPGVTDVRLDMFFQASSFFFLPIWDSMQTVITNVMMNKFMERAKVIMREQEGAGDPTAQAEDDGSHDKAAARGADAPAAGTGDHERGASATKEAARPP